MPGQVVHDLERNKPSAEAIIEPASLPASGEQGCAAASFLIWADG